jgi:hypothetical protein
MNYLICKFKFKRLIISLTVLFVLVGTLLDIYRLIVEQQNEKRYAGYSTIGENDQKYLINETDSLIGKSDYGTYFYFDFF